VSSTPGGAAPRLYHLHPLTAGPIAAWGGHFARARAMGFDGVHVASPFAAGAGGSLALPADPFTLDPRLAGDGGEAAPALAGVAAAAAAEGLSLWLEMIVPFVAADGLVARTHPHWIDRDAQGAPRPGGGDGGLALALDAGDGAQLEHVAARGRTYLDAGVAGLRFTAAHHVPAAFWRVLLAQLRAGFPDAWFVADVLGAPAHALADLAGVGFDGVLDSSRWWNFHDAWFLQQHAALRAIGVPFAFPEHDGEPRRAAQLASVEPELVARSLEAAYLKAVALGTGLFMPMGFEYGCRRPLDPVRSSPADWEAETTAPLVDLSASIAAANALGERHRALRVAGELRRVNAPNARVAALARLSHPSPARAEEAVFVAANPELGQSDGLELRGLLTAVGGRFETLEEIRLDGTGEAVDPTRPLTLAPGALRLLASRPVKPKAARTGRAASAEKRLLQVAAQRVVIEKVSPELDGGRFPVKRVVGDLLEVEADIFMDGHDQLAAALLVRPADAREWRSVAMRPLGNDRWAGEFPLTRNGRWKFTLEAWRDAFASWRVEVTKKNDAAVPIGLELEEGRRLVERTAAGAAGATKAALEALAGELRGREGDQGFQLARLFADDTAELMRAADLQENLTRYEREPEVVVDRTVAAFAAWYELFPRSQSDDPQRHGTFDDVIAKLPYVRDMGFDVLYFPPIHPIGRTNRKGRNNSLTPMPDDPGSPYAIGSEEGGHDAIHPELGTFDDFHRLIEAAHDHGLELALDFAIQCSPDHPWLKQHPDWFDWRPDGSLKYAENPPKKYEDITTVDFYREGALPGLWLALKDVVTFWVDHGVKIFRVDNPHTKPLPFWEWLIAEVQAKHPDVVFLSEAFTRPKMMQRLAKIGFTQSYSYFTWRETKDELQSYLTELTREEAREHMRPNFFVNTPDINPYYLQTGGRAGFQVRAVLAATLSTLWGVYSGFELCEGTPLPGREEYLDSEKYEIKAWDWDRPGHIRADIRLLNGVRRDNPALWSFTNLEFHHAWNDHVMVYSKMTGARDNVVLVAVNLDPHHAQGAAIEVPLWHFGLADHGSIEVEDLVTGARFTWTGKVQHVWLDPAYRPYQLWRLVPPGLAAASPFVAAR
jgi:starch synthase (maltosyl-transferring)